MLRKWNSWSKMDTESLIERGTVLKVVRMLSDLYVSTSDQISLLYMRFTPNTMSETSLARGFTKVLYELKEQIYLFQFAYHRDEYEGKCTMPTQKVQQQTFI